MRIDQLLAYHHFSRKAIKQALAQRHVLVNGKPARKLAQNVDPGLQIISVNGRLISEPRHHYFLLNKPIGAVTATKDAEHSTVIDLIDPQHQFPNLYPIGRLDRDTSGLLLITDNGPLGFQLLHPQYHVKKTYYVEVNGPLEEGHRIDFARGISFHDGRVCKPATLEILSTNSHFSQARVTISEGKFHQVKKMFLSIGVKVTRLQRIQFGPFHLDTDLKEGDFRTMTPLELEEIRSYLDATY